jgi:hypothetical protein
MIKKQYAQYANKNPRVQKKQFIRRQWPPENLDQPVADHHGNQDESAQNGVCNHSYHAPIPYLDNIHIGKLVLVNELRSH